MRCLCPCKPASPHAMSRCVPPPCPTGNVTPAAAVLPVSAPPPLLGLLCSTSSSSGGSSSGPSGSGSGVRHGSASARSNSDGAPALSSSVLRQRRQADAAGAPTRFVSGLFRKGTSAPSLPPASLAEPSCDAAAAASLPATATGTGAAAGPGPPPAALHVEPLATGAAARAGARPEALHVAALETTDSTRDEPGAEQLGTVGHGLANPGAEQFGPMMPRSDLRVPAAGLPGGRRRTQAVLAEGDAGLAPDPRAEKRTRRSARGAALQGGVWGCLGIETPAA